MSILQVNLWTCEICGKTYATKEEVSPFDDPVVGYPSKEEWNFVGPDEKLACPECLRSNQALDSDGTNLKLF